MTEQIIKSVEDLIKFVQIDSSDWNNVQPWFRGEPQFDVEGNNRTPVRPLIPKLYRKSDHIHKELKLLQHFRIKAPLYLDLPIPQRGHTDQWLFLAQHAGLPTRLLDWTESLLVALYFATIEGKKKKGAVVWMLNPNELTRMSVNKDSDIPDYSLSWLAPENDPNNWLNILLSPDARIRARRQNKKIDFRSRFFTQLRSTKNIGYNVANINIRAAWEDNPQLATEYPVSILPTYIHPRISMQMSRFTIWGRNSLGLTEIGIPSKFIKKYVIDENEINNIESTLRLLGISRLSLFPELDSLAKDLEQHY